MFHSKATYFALLLSAIFSMNLHATSLFNEHSFSALTADKRAMSLGDTVTVVVLENAQAKSRSGSSNANDISISAAGSSPQGSWPYALGIGADYSGDAVISRNGYIKAQITAVVSEIDQFGNLVINGTQNITIDGELQSIELSGRVRPVDIMANNTLLSSRIMDAKITFTGEEQESEGVLSSLFSWLGF
ncbi:flagellar basal body L-ring protein FlgH [Pseudoalteromonas sp. MMG022]|uniref:flagellar basal body L-ring protein FlgH n=1 Tax=Pseudoalteromonas sp. MMG022 TaxID=2909978 RepID=UPI001F262301|nr:flagellar basal body L-ring protein FlgH [Pseudoalteromonas sp. MMG022]MCF6436984.1 flagellar basal body L-ring protein FlgH [Pseudoalteromonas sp. MMG022]